MPENGLQIDGPSRIEIDIIRSFGWTLVDYEDTLYQRFLLLSASSSLVSLEDFRLGLRAMESKGYISSLYLGDRKAYKRLLVDDDITVKIEPKAPLDEMRLVLGSMKAKIPTQKGKARERRLRTKKREKKSKQTEPIHESEGEPQDGPVIWGSEARTSPRVTKDLVEESSFIGKELFESLRNWVQQKYGTGMQSRMVLRSYVENMCHSLGESEEIFLEYLREEAPDFLPKMQDVLEKYGSDFLLLSLRLV